MDEVNTQWILGLYEGITENPEKPKFPHLSPDPKSICSSV